MAGDRDSERVTVLANLLEGVTVMSIATALPPVEVTVSELVVTVKSTTLIVITPEDLDRDPNVPVTTTV